MEAYDLAEGAIVTLMAEFPGARRGATATRGHQNYERLCNAIRQVGRLHPCECGRRALGWTAPEFIATVNGKTWSIGYDAKSNKISCGDKAYHSSYYSGTPACS
jgi:hypothetical protein